MTPVKDGRMVCRCGRPFEEHTRGGGITYDKQMLDGGPSCDRYDASTPTIQQAVVRGGKQAPDGLEGDYL